jgi:phasin family protein
MAEQTAATEAIEAQTKALEAVVEAAAAPAEAAAKAMPAVEVKPARPATRRPVRKSAKPAVEARPAPKAKRPARKKAAASKRIQAAKAAASPRPARKPAVNKQTRPARAGSSKGVTTMTKQTNGIDTGLFAAEQFKNVFGDVNERAKAAAERSAKIAEELADLTRGNVEAFVASSKIAAKGVEALSQDAAEYSRKSFEEASAALKGFAEVKSATDFFKLQGDYARAAFDNAVAESARLSETVLKLAGDVAEPITSRYTVAAERAKTLAA